LCVALLGELCKGCGFVLAVLLRCGYHAVLLEELWSLVGSM